MNVLLTPSALIPSFHINVRRPLEVLERLGGVSLVTRLSGLVTQRDLAWADVVVFCRSQEACDLRLLERATQLSKKTIYDIDDNFVRIPLDIREGRFHRDPVRLHVFRQMVQRCTIVRAYSKPLASELLAWREEVHLCRGNIDFSLIAGLGSGPRGPNITVTYASNRVDGRQIVGLLEEIVLQGVSVFQRPVKICFWGFSPPRVATHEAVLIVDLPKSYEEFIQQLFVGSYDIGLAPALSNAFFDSKTNTKYRDYGISNIAGIYSQTPLYEADIEHGRNGVMTGNSASSWIAAIKRLSENDEERNAIARAARDDVLNRYGLAGAVSMWREDLGLLGPA